MQQKQALVTFQFLLINTYSSLEVYLSTEITGPAAVLCLFQLCHSDHSRSTLTQCHICAFFSYVSSFMSQHYFKFSVLKCSTMSQSLISWKWVVALQLPFKDPFGPDFTSYCFSSMKKIIFFIVASLRVWWAIICATGTLFIVINTNSDFSCSQVILQLSMVLPCCAKFHLSLQISPSADFSITVNNPSFYFGF